MVRIIREEEPQRPSTRLDSLRQAVSDLAAGRPAANPSHGSSAIEIAQCRATDIRVLARALRGELDLIVMKCLEKDRTRRYETASNLGSDVRRYLSDEPIEARRDSAVYVLGKLLRRHRVPFGLAAAVIVFLTGFSIVMSMLYRRAITAEASAQAALGDSARARTQLERALDEAQQLRRAEALAQFDLDREREERAASDVKEDLSRKRRSLKFDQTPLREVFTTISESIAQNVVIHWKALNEVGIRADQPVTLAFDGESIANILRAVFRAADEGREVLAWRPSDRAILIGTRESTEAKVRFRAPGISEQEVIDDVVFDSDKVRAILHRRIPEVSLQDLPAATIAEWLSGYGETRIELDPAAVDTSRKISIRVKHLRLSQVLWMIGMQLCEPSDEVAWLIEPQRVLLSTRKSLCARLGSIPLHPDIDDSEVARRAALDLAHRFLDDPGRIATTAWDVVRRPGGDLAVYRPALRLAQATRLLTKNNNRGFGQFTIGVALYRVGAYEASLDALSPFLPDREDSTRVNASHIPTPLPLAFAAMIYHRLERPVEAADMLARVRELMKAPPWNENDECWESLGEAEQLIEGGALPTPRPPLGNDADGAP